MHIVNISHAFHSGDEVNSKDKTYVCLAEQMLENLYDFGYGGGKIFFKPTLVQKVPVRTDWEQTLSYFIFRNRIDIADGFAISKHWQSVLFRLKSIKKQNNYITTLGTCQFNTKSGGSTVADFTFGFRVTSEKLRIFMHISEGR